MARVIAGDMQDPKNNYRVSVDAVKNPVRKSFREDATESSIVDRMPFWFRFQLCEGIGD